MHKIKLDLELEIAAHLGLMNYMVRHEDDIARDINDFGDLKAIYHALFGADPKKQE